MAERVRIGSLMRPGWQELIERERVVKRLGRVELARKAGIAYETLQRTLDEGKPTEQTLSAICDALGLDVGTVLLSSEEIHSRKAATAGAEDGTPRPN